MDSIDNSTETIGTEYTENTSGMEQAPDTGSTGQEYDAVPQDPQALGLFAEAPEQSQKNSRIAITVLAAGVTILVILIAALAFFFLRGDRAKLARAFKNLGTDIGSMDVCSADEKETLVNSFVYGDASTAYSLNIGEIPDIPVTIGIDGTLDRSFDGQKMSCENSLSVMNADVTELNLYADGTEVYVSVPALFDETISADTSNLAEDFNNSAIAGIAGISIPDDVDYRPFGDGTKDHIELTDMSQFMKDHADELEKMYRNMEVSKDSGSLEYELSDGSSVKVKAYHGKIPAEDIAALLNDTVQEEGDLSFTAYVDSDTQIRYLELEAPIILDGFPVEFKADFRGADSCVEDIEAEISVSHPEDGTTEDTTSPVYVFSGEKYICSDACDMKGTHDISVSMEGDVNMDIAAAFSAAFEDGSLEFELDRLKLEQDGETVAQMSGSCTFGQLTDVVTIPSAKDDAIDICNMDLMDMLTLAGELEDRYNSLSDALSALGL